MTIDQNEIHIWLTRDEREIPLAEMETPHIQNAVARLKPWVRVLKAKVRQTWDEDDAADLGDLQGWLERFKKELKRRGHSDKKQT